MTTEMIQLCFSKFLKSLPVSLAFIALSSLVISASDGTEPLTLNQVLEQATENNLGLMAEKLNLTIAEATQITAKLRPNPVFSFSGDHLDLLGTGFDTMNNGGPPEIAWRVDVPMERAHKRQLRMETADFAKAIAEAQLMNSIRKLRMDVHTAFIDVIEAKANLTLARDNLRTYEELVNTNQVRVKAGAISPLELTRSEVAMLQFRGHVTRAELALSTAKIRLQSLLGRRTLTDDFDVSGELQLPGLMEEPLLPVLQENAFTERPDLKSLQLSQARTQSDLKLQLALGKVDYSWGSEYRRQQGVSGKSNSLGFFFSVPLPFYNRNQGEIARAQAQQQQFAMQMEALKAQVQAEVKVAYQEFVTAHRLVQTIERDLLQPAQRARETSAYVYKSGGSSLIEFLDAQRAYNETVQSYYEAQAAYQRAIVQLNSTVGKEVIHQ